MGTAVQQSPAAQSGEVWDTGTMHGSPLSPRPVSGIQVTRGVAAVTLPLSRVTCHDTRQHCQHQAESCDYYLGDWWQTSGLSTDPHITSHLYWDSHPAPVLCWGVVGVSAKLSNFF